MVLIPPDIGLRLRQQTELLTQPVAPLKEIPADLPDLKTGQVFNARIQEVLPENTYRALVAGKTVTLSLPESVKSGDMLELVVLDRTPKTIIAQLAAQGGAAPQAGAAAYPFATFSRAAQLIGALLPAEGEAPSAAPLNRGLPLLAQPPRSGAELSSVLSKAVTESGLFYESHQAQWIAGKLHLADLLQEPQGMHSSPETKIAAQADKLLLLANLRQEAQGQSAASTSTALQAGKLLAPSMPQEQSEQTAAQTPAGAQAGKQLVPGLPQELSGQTAPALPGSAQTGKLPQASLAPEPNAASPQTAANAGNAETAAAARAKEMATPQLQTPVPNSLATGREEAAESKHLQSNSQTSQPMTAASIPDELRPLIQQQLDAAGTQRLIWHGEVWPGQTMQWKIEWEGQGGGNPDQNDAEPWSTTLRLTTPRLGDVAAALRLGADGVHIALTTSFDGSADVLREGSPLLEQALAAAGVPLRGFTVKQAQEPESTGSADGQP